MPSNKIKNPDQMTHKKFVPGANPLVQIPRGWVAGTAGLPGDIEGLARLFAKYAGAPNSLAEKWGQQETPTLPTSEFYKEWLPLKDEGIGAAELNTLGSLTGGMGSTTLAGLAAKYGTKATKAAVANAAVPSRLSKQAGVIKAKGLAGNWLSGTYGVESAMQGLKGPGRDVPAAISEVQQLLAAAPEGSAAQATYQQMLGEMSRKQALNDFVDKQLTNYIKSDMATPTDPVRLAIEAWPEKKQKLQGLAQAKLDFLNAKTQRLMTERDAPAEFLTRHRQDVLAAEKAKDRIDLQEASHRQVAPEDIRAPGDDWISEDLGAARAQAGFPEAGLAKTGLAQDWETITDQSVLSLPAKIYQKSVGPNWETNMWLDKTAPDVAVHSVAHPRDFADSLGFTHLIDELKNATNSASGLPKDLLLDPSTLGKTTLPQAVEHVAKINAWRAAQRAEADLVKANNAATVLHKDYPEKGMKWVELKAGKELPEGYKIENLKNVPTLYGPDGKSLAQNWDYDTLVAQANRSVLEDALRYEGDIMGNCVGAYCDNVTSGDSRVFSLRDKKGQSHVTIETQSGIKAHEGAITADQLPPEVYESFNRRNILDPSHMYVLDETRGHYVPTLAPTPDAIHQIKGSGKKDDRQRIRMANTGYADNPDAHLIPYIQDFIRSGEWSDIKNLEHSGMQKWNGRYLAREDIDALSPDELNAFASRNVDKPGFAHGGSVYSPDRVDEIVTQHRNSEYDPARVDALVAQLKDEMYG